MIPPRSLLFLPVLCGLLGMGSAFAAQDTLVEGFQNPPHSAKPHTWWHWMNGNVTREGITADLEAMARAGVGGAQIFAADCGIPAGPVAFMSPEWRAMMKHAASEADRLGIELCIHNCAGWSSSGGPWNTPENAMQRITISETNVKGPASFQGTLPQPETKLDFYRDIAVLAFPTPEGEGTTMSSLAPKVTAEGKTVEDARLFDDKTATAVELPLPGRGKISCLDFEFADPLAARSARIVLAAGAGIQGIVQVSEDGKTYRDLKFFAFPFNGGDGTLSIALGDSPAAVRFYRLKFIGGDDRTKRLLVSEVSFSPALRIGDVLAKGGMNMGYLTEKGTSRDTKTDPSFAVTTEKMVDLTDRVKPDGRLDWDVPEGRWTILRIGHTPTGKDNHPAPKEGTGLECDKLSKEALDAHWQGYVQKVIDDLGPLAGKDKAFNNVLIDSYEVGGQNWTPKFRQEFQQRRGYDPQPWLVTLTGRVVDTPERSERFLWDMRRTIADLFAENYFGHFRELCHQNGLNASIEPYTGPFESLQSGEPADIPMGEFWVHNKGSHPSLKLASSVGHIYGRPVIGAESFTAKPDEDHGRWLDDPYALKAVGDMVFCKGVNRYIFHRYAMQPWLNRWPGMTMGQWGTHFERTNTWWNQGSAWLQYIARCQFLLQQGRFVGDIALFAGESAPVQWPTPPESLPPGYDYDGINAGVLLKQARVEDGQLVLDSGMRYRLLVLGYADRLMTPELLRKLRDFAAAGLTISGAPPTGSPSLAGYPDCDNEVRSLVSEIWGDCDGKTITEHRVGKGKVVWGQPLEDVLAGLSLKPDFEFNPSRGSELAFIHRTLKDADIYFVSNQRDCFDMVDGTFRVEGRTPEFWHPDTGLIEKAPVYSTRDGRTTVPLKFDPVGSVFVVFREPAVQEHLVRAEFTPSDKSSVTPPPNLKIIHAEYGAFETTAVRAANVTGSIKSQIEGGRRKIHANNEALDGDPAPGEIKHLQIIYSLNGSRKSVLIDEDAAFELPEKAEFVSALYGILSEKPLATADVTAALSGQIKDGRLQVKVENKLAGKDPAPMTRKKLRVTYECAGTGKVLDVEESQTLTLPTSADIPQLKATPWSLSLASDGRLEARSSEPGVFTLTSSDGKTVQTSVTAVPAALEVTGPWEVAFPPHWGAPEKITLPGLMSWTDSPESGVKYFSGTATYVKDIEIPESLFANNNRLWLNLGTVKNLAEVSVNGKPLGILWKPPFRADITSAAKPGKNRLEIQITNLWPNRLIGDEQLPPDCEWGTNKALKAWPQWLLEGKPSPTGRLTFTTWHHWTKNEKPLPSGLLGPVTVATDVKAASN